jgi:hypothetical protein
MIAYSNARYHLTAKRPKQSVGVVPKLKRAIFKNYGIAKNKAIKK